MPVETGVPRGGADIGTLAVQIDAHRKRQQQLHPDLTLTNCYNLLERLRRIAAATPERSEPVSPEQIARRFTRAPTKKVAELIDTLAALGQIQHFRS